MKEFINKKLEQIKKPFVKAKFKTNNAELNLNLSEKDDIKFGNISKKEYQTNIYQSFDLSMIDSKTINKDQETDKVGLDDNYGEVRMSFENKSDSDKMKKCE